MQTDHWLSPRRRRSVEVAAAQLPPATILASLVAIVRGIVAVPRRVPTYQPAYAVQRSADASRRRGNRR